MAKRSHQQRLEQRRRERQAAKQAERERHRRQLMVLVTAVSVLAVVGVVYAVVATVRGDDDAGAASTPAPSGSPSATPSVDPAKDPANKPKSIPTAIAPAPKRPAALPAGVDCSYPKSKEAASKKVDPPEAGKVTTRGTEAVTMATSIGDLKLTLDRGLAPCAVNSFLSLAKQKYFDGTSCHRMTVGAGLQVLQCGDPTGTSSGGPGYGFADEVFPQLKYGRGTLAMANSGANTNGSQFFIVYGDGSALEPKYSAFGTVDAAGLARIDKVARGGVTPVSGPGDGKPNTPVQVKTVS